MTNGPSANEEFQRLIRAVNDSLERESELQRQLRRTKDSLVSVALRLQISIKITQEDQATIAQLQNETTELRTNAIVARQQADEAVELTNALNLQIMSLKRKIKALEDSKAAAAPNPNDVADSEVDAMFEENQCMYQIPPNTAKYLEIQSPSPFERWKMQEFLYSSDTPAASVNHDAHVVNMLSRAATSEMKKTGVDRPTQIYLGKKRIPRNIQSPKKSLPELSGTGGYFLGIETKHWGEKESYNVENMGRHNLWIKGNKDAKESLRTNTRSKKELKSLRLPGARGTTADPRSPTTY